MASKICVFSQDSNPNIDPPARFVKRSEACAMIRRGLAVQWHEGSMVDGLIELETHAHVFDTDLLRPSMRISSYDPLFDGGELNPAGPPRGLLLSYPIADQRTGY